MEQVLLARVAVSAATYAFDKPYDYIVPPSLAEKAQAGVRVTVPFGRGNKRSEALILSTYTGEKKPEHKQLDCVLDSETVMDQGQMRLAFWLRERYFCTIYDAVKVILPAGLWYRIRETYHLTGQWTDEAASAKLSGRQRARAVYEAVTAAGGSAELEALKAQFGEGVTAALRELVGMDLVAAEATASRRLGDKLVRRVALAVPPEEAMASAEAKRKSAPLRYEVVKLLSAIGSALSTDICYFTGASTATLRNLQKAGIVTMEAEEQYRVPSLSGRETGSPITLNEEQERACEGIEALFWAGKPACALLYGVTGSGKTLVYIRLLQSVVESGKTGMVLVPEIALTPQMMEKFSAYFGDKVAMLHSSLCLSERYDQWKRIRRGEVQVVLGTRSAVFAPLKNLGMVILDEEQESSYQSENLPRYHARDVAKFLCAENNAVLLLGSATPTVETAYYAKTGRYHAFSIQRRYNDRPLPRVVLADMRREVKQGNSGAVSGVLYEELRQNIERGEQSILFLNRRGNSRMLLCGECGAVPECPRCSVPMTYHSANGRLMCHYCGHSERAWETCDDCGGIMKHVGFGTQKVEEELRELFPGVGVLRMDADTAAGGHEKILQTFRDKQIPILLGTQMVAKGLDFENVTLVGVLAADLSLYVDSFRAAERTFSLLTQVVGRAGRGEKEGRAVIQTYNPDNDVIVSAARQDYTAFYQSEIRMRRVRRYPPFADIFTLTVSGGEEGAALRAAAKLRDGMRRGLAYPSAANMGVEVLGPAPAPVLKVNNRYRCRVLWVGKNAHQTRELMSYYLKAFYNQKENRGLNLFIDCNALD